MQTTNCPPRALNNPLSTASRAPRPARTFVLVEEPFDLEFFPSNAVRLIPVDFRSHYLTIGQSQRTHPLQFSPVPTPISLSQAAEFSDSRADRDYLNARERANQVHVTSPAAAAARQSCPALPSPPAETRSPGMSRPIPACLRWTRDPGPAKGSETSCRTAATRPSRQAAARRLPAGCPATAEPRPREER